MSSSMRLKPFDTFQKESLFRIVSYSTQCVCVYGQSVDVTFGVGLAEFDLSKRSHFRWASFALSEGKPSA